MTQSQTDQYSEIVRRYREDGAIMQEAFRRLESLFTTPHNPGIDNVFTDAFLIIRDAKAILRTPHKERYSKYK